MKITYDPAKREATLIRRKLDMARACEFFEGATITIEDDRKDYGEKRYISVGFLDQRMVFIAWTPRGATRRIISMRKANDREQAEFGPRFTS